MYPENLKDIRDAGVRARVAIERRIVKSLLDEFSEQGFTFWVDNGGDDFIPCDTKEKALTELLNTDDDQLGPVPKGDSIPLGWIRLVYGNDGWDVMSDCHTILDKYMPKTLALVEELS